MDRFQRGMVAVAHASSPAHRRPGLGAVGRAACPVVAVEPDRFSGLFSLTLTRHDIPKTAAARSFIGSLLRIGPSLDLVHGHYFRTFPGAENQRHPAGCVCHRRPSDRSNNGYTNA